MTPTNPAPSLAEVIEAGELAWLANGGDILDNAKHAHQARAVAAWLERPEIAERMAEALAKQDGQPFAREDIEAYAEYREQARAAIAAVVGEGGS